MWAKTTSEIGATATRLTPLVAAGIFWRRRRCSERLSYELTEFDIHSFPSYLVPLYAICETPE